jgi:hypothetical protein
MIFFVYSRAQQQQQEEEQKKESVIHIQYRIINDIG